MLQSKLGGDLEKIPTFILCSPTRTARFNKRQKVGLKSSKNMDRQQKRSRADERQCFCPAFNVLASCKKRRWPMDDKIPITWLNSHPPLLLPLSLLMKYLQLKTWHRLINMSGRRAGEFISPLSVSSTRTRTKHQNILYSSSVHSVVSCSPRTNISNTFISRGPHADVCAQTAALNWPQLLISMLKSGFAIASCQTGDVMLK